MPFFRVTRTKNSKNANPKMAPVIRPTQTLPSIRSRSLNVPRSEAPAPDIAANIPKSTAITPSAIFSSSGMIPVRISMIDKVRRVRRAKIHNAENGHPAKPIAENPATRHGTKTNIIPEMNSTTGYCILIRVLQWRHRPR